MCHHCVRTFCDTHDCDVRTCCHTPTLTLYSSEHSGIALFCVTSFHNRKCDIASSLRDGHIMFIPPGLVRSLKLSNLERSPFPGGGPRGNPAWCLFFFPLPSFL